MNKRLKNNLIELDKDLSNSWVQLSDKVRDLAADLRLKTAESEFAAEADHLTEQTFRLCEHVVKFHADVIDLIETIDTRVPLPELDTTKSPMNETTDQENIQIQREKHELSKDFKDVLKALFMWVDNPKERFKRN
jgi:hypothetical protein